MWVLEPILGPPALELSSSRIQALFYRVRERRCSSTWADGGAGPWLLHPCSRPPGAGQTGRTQRENCCPQGEPCPRGLRGREMAGAEGDQVCLAHSWSQRGACPRWDGQGELGERQESRSDPRSESCSLRLPSEGLTQGTHVSSTHPKHRVCLCWALPQCPLLTPAGICF